jgi:L-iditol 2-dehydrogenase
MREKSHLKAVAKVRREPGVEVIETREDPLGEEDVLLRMEAASICGSDIGFYNFTPAYQKFAKVPVIMGHEFSGIIEKVGSHVKDFAKGERVASESVIYCGECRNCRMGFTNICQNFMVFGMHRNGGFAECVSLNRKFLHKIPEGVTASEAAVVEPLSVVVNALDEVADLTLGETSLVVGPGPLGLLSAEVLRAKGIPNIAILGIGIDAYRLAIARDKLSYKTFDIEKEGAKEEVAALTRGFGFDVVVVAAGSPSALKESVPFVAKGGQIIVLGIFPEEVNLPVSDLVRRQISLRGSYGSNWRHYEKAISLFESKQVKVSDIITHRFALEDANKAFEMARDKTGCKVQFTN